jgi:hypothetical protein
MPELSLDLAIALVLTLILALLIAIVILYRLRGQAETRRRLEQGGRVSQMLKRREELEPPPEKLVAALEQVVASIGKAAKSKRSMVKVTLDSKIELKAVASDILMLRMTIADGWSTLHKSLEKVRIKNIKKIARGYEIHISST